MEKRRSLYIVCLAEFILLLLIDQGTKLLALKRLKDQSDLILIPGVLRLTYLENKGIAFGLLENRSLIFGVFALIFVVLLVLIFIKIPNRRHFLPLMFVLPALGAGALGNCIDRTILGHVVDFIYIELIHFPVFNFADVCVVCGALILALLLLFHYEEKDFLFLKPGHKRT